MTDRDDIPDMQDVLQDAWVENLQGRRAAYENSVVRHILSKHGLPIAHYERELRTLTSRRAFTLAWFHATFPDFPVLLGVSKLWGISDIDLGDLFKRFTKTPIFVSYNELAHQLGADGDLAMVFGWPRLSNFVVLHNTLHDLSVRSPMLLRPVGKDPPTIYAVELFDSFLERVAWEPEIPE